MGRPYSSAAQAGPGRLGCNRRYVRIRSAVYRQTHTERSYPSAAQAGLEGLGCTRRCVGVGSAVYTQTFLGRPFPPGPSQDRGDPGASAAVGDGRARCMPFSPSVKTLPHRPR